MRVIASLLVFALAAPAAATRAETPPAALAKFEFARTIRAPGMSKLLGYDQNRLYLAYPDGSVKIIGIGGEASAAITLRAKDRNGMVILKHPEAAVTSDTTVYVVDSELSQVAMFSADGKYQGSFGHWGSDTGELRAPQDIAFRNGVLYVADSGNGRIQMYGDNGVFLDTLDIDHAPGNKTARQQKLPFQLNRPIGIALDPSGGTTYVLDSESSLFVSSTVIKAYGPDGAFLGQLPKHGNPIAISAAPDGLYAAERDSYTIQEYDPGGRLAGTFGSRGEGAAQFKSLDGLATDSGHVYLGDRARGVVFDFRTNAAPPLSALGPQRAARTFVRWSSAIPASVDRIAWDGKETLYGINAEHGVIVRIRNGAVEGELKPKDKSTFPVAGAVDPSGALWVVDKNKAHVVELDASGAAVVTFGNAGSHDGQLDHPSDIAISSGGIIYVADAGNHRVQLFSQDGTFLGRVGGAPGAMKKPEAIALDPQGNLYVLDTERAIVSVYSQKGEALAEFGQSGADLPGTLKKPRGLMATRDEVFVAEPDRVKVYAHDGAYLRAFGAPGTGNGELKDASALATRDATSFFVADTGNRRIQIFTTLYKPAPPAQLTAQPGAHAVELRWAASSLPYVAQYRIYRSREEQSGFVRIGASKVNLFSDEGLPPDEQYFYRVAAESDAGYEGLASAPVSATPLKYAPPRPENIQAAATPTQVKLSWNPLDLRYIGSYLVYLKAGDGYAKIGETVVPEFTVDALAPGTDYTFYVAARSVDGIESEKTAVHATTPLH